MEIKNGYTTNKEIIEELGWRLQTERLRQNITQAKLAQAAGISRRTLVGAERGESFTVDTLLAILRVLGRLDQLNAFLPEPKLSPVELSKLSGCRRKKASRETPAQYDVLREEQKPWMWKEDTVAYGN